MNTAATRDSQSGLVIVDKPPGITSHDVVARARRIAATRKVGHAGTLDPMATGVLVLGVNKATRLLGHLALSEKGYDATIRLGSSTHTDDAEGEIVSRAAAGGLTEQDVRDASVAFVGDIEQVPSSVSAIKVDGQRAYARVRAGETVVLASRPVTISALTVSDLRHDGDFLDVDVSVQCSSGTYIRALARDLGSALGVGGHLTRLRRTSAGVFGLSDAQALPVPEDAEQLRVVDLDTAARRCFSSYVVGPDSARDVSFGRTLEGDLGHPGPVAVFDESGGFLALYEQRGTTAEPVAVFAGAG